MNLQLNNIHKKFPAMESYAVEDVSFSLSEGETLALLGESGSGKTTLLRMIAGLETPTKGSITLKDKIIFDKEKGVFIKPEKRKIGMFFQHYALFPHLNVFENISYGLDKKEYDTTKRKERVMEMLKLVGLLDYEKRFIHELSGGQQQRVALARTLAPDPKLILLDEPFSNLDEQLKTEVRQDIKTILSQSKATTILVTHDLQDALSLANQLAVMRNGKIEQLGTSQNLYQNPRTNYVATLFGEILPLSSTTFTRPEWLEITDKTVPDTKNLTIQIKDLMFYGNRYQIIGKTKSEQIFRLNTNTHYKFEKGDWLTFQVRKTFSLS